MASTRTREQIKLMLAQVDSSRESVAHAVRESMAYLEQTNPGRAVELRVVPFRVVQLLGGTTHRRGTPPAVVECSAATWLDLCTGKISWENAIATGALSASGVRSDLSGLIEELAK